MIVADPAQTEATPAEPAVAAATSTPEAAPVARSDSHTTMIHEAPEDRVLLIHQGGAFGAEGISAIYTPEQAFYVGTHLMGKAFEMICQKIARGADDGR